MVEDKERLLRNRELHDLFAGMKAHENKAGRNNTFLHEQFLHPYKPDGLPRCFLMVLINDHAV